MTMAKQLLVTKVRGSTRSKPAQRATLIALGLGKIDSHATHNDTASIRGMIEVVKHMVTVKEIS